MDQIKRIYALLADATDILGEVARSIPHVPELYSKETKLVIGSAIYELMELRTKIHDLRSDIASEHQNADEKNRTSYPELETLMHDAWSLEQHGQFQKAETLYRRVLAQSNVERFVLLAQAGLFRLTDREGD